MKERLELAHLFENLNHHLTTRSLRAHNKTKLLSNGMSPRTLQSQTESNVNAE